ncbi:MAG: glycosyltransferase [Faecousia sp.]
MSDCTIRKSKRLLIVSQCFYPSVNRGGPAVSVTNLAKALAAQMEVSVITASYESGTKQTYAQIHEGKNRLFGCDVFYLKDTSPKALERAMQEASPDTIYISSLFSGAYTVPALRYAKKKKIRTVLAPRGELQPQALHRKTVKKHFYLGALKLFGLMKNIGFHATSTQERAQIKKHFPKAQVFTAQNLVIGGTEASRTREKKAGELYAVAVCRVHPIKGLDRAISALKTVKGRIVYDIYGPIEDEAFYRRCITLAQELPGNVKVRFCGAATPENIPQILQNSDVFLMPTQTENFGNAIVEALQNGCPALISDATPWKDLSEAKAGAALPISGDYAAVLQMFADMSEQEWLSWSVGARTYINSKLNSRETLAIYLKMLEG